jgi:hypothetical protein
VLECAFGFLFCALPCHFTCPSFILYWLVSIASVPTLCPRECEIVVEIVEIVDRQIAFPSLSLRPYPPYLQQ